MCKILPYPMYVIYKVLLLFSIYCKELITSVFQFTEHGSSSDYLRPSFCITVLYSVQSFMAILVLSFYLISYEVLTWSRYQESNIRFGVSYLFNVMIFRFCKGNRKSVVEYQARYRLLKPRWAFIFIELILFTPSH